MSEHRCQASVWDGRFGSYPCTRQGKLLEDDKWYCRQHSPTAKKEREAARSAAWKAEDEAREQRRQAQQETNRRAACYPKLLAALEAAANALDAVGAHVPSEQAREAIREANP